ncbi:TPA: hypothetical protein I4G69_003003 [Enterobacter asburiae]|nr:hypothetical protein [Enterobacter asburiae]
MFYKISINRFITKSKSSLTIDKLLNLSIFALFYVFCLLCLRYQYYLLDYRQWGDESETVVAAKMMAAGMKLYSDIFNHHGPLTFLPGLLTEVIGDFGIQGHRVPMAILQILAIFSIYKSPVLHSTQQRIITSAISAVIILVYLPDDFGHTYQYQTITGNFLVIILSQYILPILTRQEKNHRNNIILGCALISSLPFLAITYLPIACLTFICAFRKDNIKYILVGTFIGLLSNILFLWVFGSFTGFFSFHIYLNTEVLPYYSGTEPGWQLVLNAISAVTSDLSHFLSIVIILYSSALLARQEIKFPWRTILLISGLCTLLVRGTGFQGTPFFYAMLPFLGLLSWKNDSNTQASKYITQGFLLLCIMKVSLLLSNDKERLTSVTIPTQTEFSNLVKEFTQKNDKIIAYSFQNIQYLLSERLPASGAFFYLPWQEKYNENPKFGIKIDACKQIKEYKPKIMLIDKWKVWHKYSWESYGNCIQDYMNKDYIQVPGKPYYIRKDLLNNSDDYFASKERKLIASPPLRKTSPITIKFPSLSKDVSNGKKLTGIGIRIGTHLRENQGNARLEIKRKNNLSFATDFALSGLIDNHYKYFAVPDDILPEGTISSLTGEGISVWESRGNNNITCLKLIYSDGSATYPPGCPLF